MTVTNDRNAAPADRPERQQSKPQLAAAAKQFESVLLSQWLQSAEDTFAAVPGTEEEDAGGQQMQGFATQQLATSMTEHGGIGIAPLVLRALNTAGDHEAAAASAHAASAGQASAVAAYAAGVPR